MHVVSRKGEGPDVIFRHPSGRMTVQVELEDGREGPRVRWAGTVRTARRLMEGFVPVPDELLKGQAAAGLSAVGASAEPHS